MPTGICQAWGAPCPRPQDQVQSPTVTPCPGGCPHPKVPILTSVSLSPALGPVPQVRGCHDQVQRGAGGFPRAEQGPNPAPAGNQCVTEPPAWGGRGLGINPHLFHKLGGANSYRPLPFDQIWSSGWSQAIQIPPLSPDWVRPVPTPPSCLQPARTPRTRSWRRCWRVGTPPSSPRG